MPDPPVLDRLSRGTEVRVEATVVADLQDHACVLAGRGCARRVLDVLRERLLAEDVLARGGRGLDELGVRRRRRRDQDRLDVVAREQLVNAHGDVAAELPGEVPRERRVDVGHRRDPEPVQPRGIRPVNARDLARSDDPDGVHGRDSLRLALRYASAASGGTRSSSSSHRTSSRSILAPSVSSTLKRSPSWSMTSPSSGARPSSPKTKPATVW